MHRISTLDVKHLVLNQPHPCLFCSATGKIISFFRLTKISPHELWIELDQGREGWNENSFLETLEKYTFSEKYDLNREDASPSSIGSPTTSLERIQKLWCAIDFEILSRETTSPLEVHLRDAISDQKGCYPGQEVIEKILSIGSSPALLAKVEWTRPIPEESEIPGVGRITTRSDLQSLVIVRKTAAKVGQILTTPSGIQGKITEVGQ